MTEKWKTIKQKLILKRHSPTRSPCVLSRRSVSVFLQQFLSKTNNPRLCWCCRLRAEGFQVNTSTSVSGISPARLCLWARRSVCTALSLTPWAQTIIFVWLDCNATSVFMSALRIHAGKWSQTWSLHSLMRPKLRHLTLPDVAPPVLNRNVHTNAGEHQVE